MGDIFYLGNVDGIFGFGFIVVGLWDFIGYVEVFEFKIDGKVVCNFDWDDMVVNMFNVFCSVII